MVSCFCLYTNWLVFKFRGKNMNDILKKVLVPTLSILLLSSVNNCVFAAPKTEVKDTADFVKLLVDKVIADSEGRIYFPSDEELEKGVRETFAEGLREGKENIKEEFVLEGAREIVKYGEKDKGLKEREQSIMDVMPEDLSVEEKNKLYEQVRLELVRRSIDCFIRSFMLVSPAYKQELARYLAQNSSN